MANDDESGEYVQTWPMFHEVTRAYPRDPHAAVTAYEPTSQDLVDLSTLQQVPDSIGEVGSVERAARQSSPPPAPEWVRAAQALIAGLQGILDRGTATPRERAAISRAWAAWSLAGATDGNILRTAHLVLRAFQAIHQSPRSARDLQAALVATAGVLHRGLPSRVRDSMPSERVINVVRQLAETADPWPAVVEGTSDLLGWKDFARAHAAAVIRAVMEARPRN